MEIMLSIAPTCISLSAYPLFCVNSSTIADIFKNASAMSLYCFLSAISCSLRCYNNCSRCWLCFFISISVLRSQFFGICFSLSIPVMSTTESVSLAMALRSVSVKLRIVSMALDVIICFTTNSEMTSLRFWYFRVYCKNCSVVARFTSKMFTLTD